MIEVLRSWEFRFLGDGKDGEGRGKRPENLWRDMSCTPDMGAVMEFKRMRVV